MKQYRFFEPEQVCVKASAESSLSDHPDPDSDYPIEVDDIELRSGGMPAK